MSMIKTMTLAEPVVPAAGHTAGSVPLLFLVANTGGGHRNAALAVGQALDRMYPGRFAPVLCDPLSGPGSARLLRFVAGLYGPVTRLAPWLWGAAYHSCDSRLAMGLLRRALLRLADRPPAGSARACRPAAVVSFHPLTGPAAVSARDRGAPGAPVMTVVTDLARTHTAWRYPEVDLIIGRPGAGVGEVVHGARGDPHGVAGAGGDPPQADPEPHLPFPYGEALLLPGMGVAARHPPARGEHEFPLQHAAAGVRRGRADGDLLAAQRVGDDVRHGRLPVR
jgi:hypothetical protein